MRRHLINATYGVVDYAAYPLGMLVVAPLVLHRLGAAEYGMWTIATAVTSVGGIIASGFCDANIQRVAKLRATGDALTMQHTVRSVLTINLLLGLGLSLGVLALAPLAARHIARGLTNELSECVIAMRIAGALILLRAIETVSVSTQRAFQQFSSTVRISTATRLLTLASAAVLALAGQRVISILAATGVVMTLGVALQCRELSKLLGSATLRPSLQRQQTRTLLRSGVFTWMQALGGVIFGQLDRVILGLLLGAAAVAPYSLCVQFAHPIFGLTASGLSFLFPYLSGRAGTASRSDLARSLRKAFVCNLLLVATGAALLLFLGPHIISAWAGPTVARAAIAVLPPIVLGSSLMGLSVTATYALLALGVFRTVAVVNLSARALILLAMTYVIHHAGLQGLARTRVAYGAFSMLLYVPMWRALRAHRSPQEQRSLLHPKAAILGSSFTEGVTDRGRS